MTSFPHISRSGDGSLRHRIDEYMAALDAYGRLEQSIKLADGSRDSDWIGDAKDLAEAEKILKSSLAHAATAIETSELRQAVEQGLLNDEQAKQFKTVKTEQEFRAKQSSSSQKASSRSKQVK